MTRVIKVRMLLARMTGDTEPAVVAAIDECVWENWDDHDERRWINHGKATWGIDYDTEFKVVVAEFAPQTLIDAFATPTVTPVGFTGPEAPPTS